MCDLVDQLLSKYSVALKPNVIMLPPLCGSRERARALLNGILVADKVVIDGREVLAITPSFIDELCLRLKDIDIIEIHNPNSELIDAFYLRLQSRNVKPIRNKGLVFYKEECNEQ